MILEFFKDLLVPSTKDQNPHWRYTTAVAHGVLGVNLALLGTLIGFPIIFIVLYILLKELYNDYYLKNGELKDCLEDSVMVILGLLYNTVWIFPILLLVPLIFLIARR